MKTATTLLFTILILGALYSATGQKTESPNAAKLTEEAKDALQLLVKEDFETLNSRMTDAAKKELSLIHI